MINSTFRFLENKGIIPPIVINTLKPLRRIWNDNYVPNSKALQSILDGDIHKLPTIDKNLVKNSFYLFSQPKSASKYIKKLFSLVFDAEEFWIGFNRGSGDFYYPRVIGSLYSNSLTISHSHSIPDKNVMEFLSRVNPPILVSYRNLADSLVSRRDMLLKDNYASQILSQEAVDKFRSASDNYQIDLIIDLFAPYYLNFYTSWKEYSKKKEVFFISYDKFINNQVNYMLDLASFFDLDINRNKIQTKIEYISSNGGVNFNKGKSGRGKMLMNAKHKDKIEVLANKFGLSDESYLGF